MKTTVIVSTLNSITLQWEFLENASLVNQTGQHKIHEFTVQYCEGGDTRRWITAYRGYKNYHQIKNLAPGSYYNLRVGISQPEKDNVCWSQLLIGTTKEEPVAIADIHQAIWKGNLSSVRQLISTRITAIDVYNKQGLTPLMEASAKGDIGTMTILLCAGADVKHVSAGVGKTALMIALQNSHIKAAMKLIEAGALWESKDRRGCTALHYAVEASQLEAVCFALENGADIEAKDNYGWTSLKRAIITRSSIDIIKELLKNGAKVNLPPIIHGEIEKPTPLMCGVLSCQSENDIFAETIPLLVENGAEVQKSNAHGYTAMDMATAKGYKSTKPDFAACMQLEGWYLDQPVI